jgi:hypothetical protein
VQYSTETAIKQRTSIARSHPGAGHQRIFLLSSTYERSRNRWYFSYSAVLQLDEPGQQPRARVSKQRARRSSGCKLSGCLLENGLEDGVGDQRRALVRRARREDAQLALFHAIGQVIVVAAFAKPENMAGNVSARAAAQLLRDAARIPMPAANAEHACKGSWQDDGTATSTI